MIISLCVSDQLSLMSMASSLCCMYPGICRHETHNPTNAISIATKAALKAGCINILNAREATTSQAHFPESQCQMCFIGLNYTVRFCLDGVRKSPLKWIQQSSIPTSLLEPRLKKCKDSKGIVRQVLRRVRCSFATFFAHFTKLLVAIHDLPILYHHSLALFHDLDFAL